MSQLVVRNLDPDLVESLKALAAAANISDSTKSGSRFRTTNWLMTGSGTGTNAINDSKGVAARVWERFHRDGSNGLQSL